MEEADAQFEIDNEHVENHEQDEGDLSDLENIFEPKKKKDNKEDQDVHNLAEFLDGFDDEKLQSCQGKFPKIGFFLRFFANIFYWCVVWSRFFTNAKS